MRQAIILAALLALFAFPAQADIYGLDSGAVTVTATPNSSSHAAGSSVGGLFKVAVASREGGSGIITNANWKSTGGATTTLVVRIWQANPVNTTCTDQTAFVGSAVDDQNLIAPPFSITPAAPVTTTGDSSTYAASSNLVLDYKNSDTTPSRYLYVCVLTSATDTADESAPVYLTLSGPQN